MRKISFGIWLLAFLFCLPALAQNTSVSGHVTSSDDGSALPGVTVQVKGTSRGTPLTHRAITALMPRLRQRWYLAI